MRLRTHSVVLRDGDLVLRPLTEHDWPLLWRWASDPEVTRWSEAATNPRWTLSALQQMYRAVSQDAYCFIIKCERREVGECWLQRLNLPRLIDRHPGADCRRIDITIGEPRWWGRGIGTRAIALLVRFAFDREGAGALFACDVLADNHRSLRAFARNGFSSITTDAGAPTVDLVLAR